VFNVSVNQKQPTFILKMIENLLSKVGFEKDIMTPEMTQTVNTISGDNEEEGILKSVISQIEAINEKVKEMNWLNKHYKILHNFAQTCSKTLDEDILFNQAFELVSQVMPTDAFYVASYNEGDTHIKIPYMIENGEIYPPFSIDYGDNNTTKTIETRKIIHYKDSSRPQEFEVIVGDPETKSLIYVPVIIDDQVKGVVSAQSLKDFAYHKEHEELLQMIGTQLINSIETARLYEKILILSRTDELTGLKNHRAFHEDLLNLIKQNKTDISLVMLDSDGLKKVNDNYGHDIGDRYLKQLTEGINKISDNNIQGYRYAGDEFMIITQSTSTHEVAELYQRLKEFYLKNPILVNGHLIYVSFSCGVASFPEHGLTVDALKKSADQALYVAKNQGKSCLIVADSI
jgi:diguanylate cyclase (GGDEF)-like protein